VEVLQINWLTKTRGQPTIILTSLDRRTRDRTRL
jgi:hypothetical protein